MKTGAKLSQLIAGRQHLPSQLRSYRLFSYRLSFGLAACLCFHTAQAQNAQHDTARYSTGLTIGTAGFGVNGSATTNWHLSEHDQIQWRVMLSGLEADLKDESFDIAGIDYNSGDLSLFALQGGLDWFPYASGWAEKVFFSTGLIYSDLDLDMHADTSKRISLGGTSVSSNALDSLHTKIENSQVMPYISLGWGNKITGEQGFDFQAELGIAISTRDADVKVTAKDPSNVLRAQDLVAEQKQIEDELGGATAFATIALSYHF